MMNSKMSGRRLVGLFSVLSRQFLGETKENRNDLQMTGPWISLISNRSTDRYTAMLELSALTISLE
jgi:hypothetical protein